MSEFLPRRMLEVLQRHGVRFVTIGGMAGALHGSPSITYDLDICYQRDPENLERLAAALRELGAKLRGVDEEVPFLLDARTLRAGDCFTFVTAYGALDILGTPAGSRGYDDLVESAEDFDLDGLSVRVVSLDDLIAMKQAAGRPKDRVHLEILGALQDVIDEES